MKAAIIGAGIGGLTTAIALQQAGIDFEIFEAAPELKPVGAGIVMASNAMQVFQRLGIEKRIMEAGLEIVNAYGVDQSFKLISGLAVKEKVAPLYGIGSYAFHRGRLQQVLLSAIDSKKIHLTKKLTSLNQDNQKVSLNFEDGSVAESDLVIGADGIKSVVRKILFGEVPLRYSGQTCWRGMTKFTLPADKKFSSYEMWGKQKGMRFGFVPTAPDEVYYFTTFFANANGRDEPGQLKHSLLQKYSAFGEIPMQLIKSTPEENIIRSDINDFKPIQRWSEGPVALLGDAAHATTPNLGQGGCQAVEDAYVIAKCLKTNASIEKGFVQYQNIRYQKAVHVVNLSWGFGKMTNIDNPFLQLLRNGFMKMMPESMAIKQLDKILKLNY
jgi:2-polyprenyl-6-methoxyphenol hydroxylase-like FAD-dependent oxidoreductase